MLQPAGSLNPSSNSHSGHATMPAVFTPLEVGDLSRRREIPNSNDPNFGQGSKPAYSYNNGLFLGLFAAIACGMVLSGMYFFFFAKNGGFMWKQNDWEDYKSTVMRRKGPDGKTLSNATKSTRLGGGSEAPKFSDRYTDETVSTQDAREMHEYRDDTGGIRVVGNNGNNNGHRKSSRHDAELKAYKHERSAKVGGLNTAPAGSHYDYTSTESSVAADPKAAKRDRKEHERREKQRRKDEKQAEKQAKKDVGKSKTRNGPPAPPPHRGPPSAAYSFTEGDDVSTQYTGDDQESHYYNNYRPPPHLDPIKEVPSRHSTPGLAAPARLPATAAPSPTAAAQPRLAVEAAGPPQQQRRADGRQLRRQRHRHESLPVPYPRRQPRGHAVRQRQPGGCAAVGRAAQCGLPAWRPRGV